MIKTFPLMMQMLVLIAISYMLSNQIKLVREIDPYDAYPQVKRILQISRALLGLCSFILVILIIVLIMNPGS